MKPDLIPNDEDQLDKPSQSWGRGRGWKGFKVRQTLQWVKGSQKTDKLPLSAKLEPLPSTLQTDEEEQHNPSQKMNLISTLKLNWRWRRRKAWGLYRLCHGNQTLEVGTGTTEGGQSPLTTSSIPCFCCRLWREVPGAYFTHTHQHFLKYSHLNLSLCWVICPNWGFYRWFAWC